MLLQKNEKPEEIVEMTKMWNVTCDLALCVQCLIFSLKYGKVWKWLIFLFFYCCFWKLKNEPSESVETKLFAMCASKYLTDQLVWRKPEQNSGPV